MSSPGGRRTLTPRVAARHTVDSAVRVRPRHGPRRRCARARGVSAWRARRDRRLRRDALEGAEPRPLDRPPFADEPGRPGEMEHQPRDDGVTRLARLARADA